MKRRVTISYPRVVDNVRGAGGRAGDGFKAAARLGIIYTFLIRINRLSR